MNSATIALPFSDILQQYVNQSHYSLGQLSRLTGIPKTTIANWLNGQVKRPRTKTDLLKISAALRLDATEATTLLHSVGCSTLTDVISREGASLNNGLLTSWLETIKHHHRAKPFQAIPALPYFVGRQKAIQEISTALLQPAGSVCSLQGMAGVGKTALAGRLAYKLRSYFPDGVLWAKVSTADPMAILSAFAQAYNHNVARYADIDSRSQVVRNLLGSKRVLIILDDAQNSEELAYLLPPTGSASVIITTRNRNLALTSGLHRFEIEAFDQTAQESLDLFQKFLGEARTEQENEILSEITQLLGGLPLALVIVASRLAYEPGWATSEFLQALQSHTTRLDELVYESQNVRRLLELSYEKLSSMQQEVFTALGVLGGEDFSLDALIAITQLSRSQIRNCLRKFYSLSLIQPSLGQRYCLHPLLRSLAQEKLANPLVQEQMIHYFINYAIAHRTHVPDLIKEEGNILHALDLAHEQGYVELFVRGTNAYYRLLHARGTFTLAERFLKGAEQVARDATYEDGLAITLHYLGQVHDKLGDYTRAETYLQEALQLAEKLKNKNTMSGVLTNLGTLLAKQGKFQQAGVHWQRGLTLATESESFENLTGILSNLGALASIQGGYDLAQSYYRRGLKIAREHKYMFRIIHLLVNLGGIDLKTGNLAQAESHYMEALSLANKTTYMSDVSAILQSLGKIARERKKYGLAKQYYEQGLQLARESNLRARTSVLLAGLGSAMVEAGDNVEVAIQNIRDGLQLARETGCNHYAGSILVEWGEVLLGQENIGQANAVFQEGLNIAQTSGNQELEAYALFGLAQVALGESNLTEAQQIGEKSYTLFVTLQHREQEKVKDWLFKSVC